MSDLPILDEKPLRELLDMGGEPGLAKELVDLFEDDTQARMAALEAAFMNQDAAMALVEAHQMKGATGNLGLLRFADLAGRVEAHLRAGEVEPAIQVAKGLPQAYTEALAALQAAFL